VESVSARILVIDNYDSFVYNLVQYIGELGAEPIVFRNDALDVAGIIDLVCLGHQAIGHVFGGSVVRAPSLMHGKTSTVHHNGVGVLAGLPQPFTATRYHSLVIDPASMPEVLEVTARTKGEGGQDDIVMGVRHREFALEGVQFHPEAILTEGGHQIVANFLAMANVSA
jgi:anthranilate synthase/aminodeoxychorismate synthase-like glutamine amidotransferase